MNKDTTRCGAAGLRRSAIVERLRLREEWSALKELPDGINNRQMQNTRVKKQNKPSKSAKNTLENKIAGRCDKVMEVAEVLQGVVVLVQVGSETRALPLRAALSALGASVVPAWSPLVTHLVWSQGGCRSTRAKARCLGCLLVSPLWVEACAAEGRKLPERIFPAASRSSDLPSPATLRKFLKKAEHENIPLHDLLSESIDSDKRPRLRLSSETDGNTSPDTSKDSNDTSRNTKENEKSCVKTAKTQEPVEQENKKKLNKTKRKLFTQKEPEIMSTDDESDKEKSAGPKKMKSPKITQQNRKDLAKAERTARRLLGTSKPTQTNKHTLATQNNEIPKIILTGMSSKERTEAWLAVRQLKGKVQKHVNKTTTHIVMGSCREPEILASRPIPSTANSEESRNNNSSPITMCNKCNSPEKILAKMFSNKNVAIEDYSQKVRNDRHIICHCDSDISGVKKINMTNDNNAEEFNNNNKINHNPGENNIQNVGNEDVLSFNILGSHKELRKSDDNLAINAEDDEGFGAEKEISENNDNNMLNKRNNDIRNVKNKPRTMNALLGAARGCRVLTLNWILDSLKANQWLHHIGYEVKHLKKISEIARVERLAFEEMHKNYAYNVFQGIRVKISQCAEQKAAAIQLLKLCGAVVKIDDESNVENEKKKYTNPRAIARIKHQYGGEPRQIQNGETLTTDIDLIVGTEKGEVNSKWVFDSVAAARMRTIRRYIND